VRKHNVTSRTFTLLEVTIVSAVSAVVFLVLILWMASLNQVATQLADKSIPSRSADFFTARLSADLDAAVVCKSSTGTALRALSPRELEVFVTARRSDGDIGVVLARWQVANGMVTRTVWDVDRSASALRPCEPMSGSVAEAQVIATGVYTPSGAVTGRAEVPFFTSVRDGSGLGTCVTSSSAQPTDGCFIDGVHVRATLVTPQSSVDDSALWTSSSSPVRVDRTFLVRTSGGTA
jgi:hypothetical protein